MASSKSDKDIVDGYKAGSTVAFKHVDSIIETVYRRWQSRFGFEKDDIFSDVHLKLLSSFRRDDFELKKGLIPFVTILVNRTCIDYIRSRDRFKTVDIDELPLPDNLPTGEEKMIKAEWAKLNFRAIQMVSKECRRLWWLHLIKKMKLREIAEIDDRTPGYIRRKLWECREKVKEFREQMTKE